MVYEIVCKIDPTNIIFRPVIINNTVVQRTTTDFAETDFFSDPDIEYRAPNHSLVDSKLTFQSSFLTNEWRGRESERLTTQFETNNRAAISNAT